MGKILIYFLDEYKRKLSPILQKHGVNCKYYPSCSDYMKEAIKKYGCFLGVLKGLKRLIRCNPFSKGGYDPLI